MKLILSALFLLFTLSLSAQTISPLRPDEKPFTLEAEHSKQLKSYPNITTAEVQNSNEVRLVSDIIYAKLGKRKLKADLFLPALPKGSAPIPLVILVHGGGWRSGSKMLDHPMASALAQAGIAALCVEYRQSSEALYPAALLDISSAIAWAKQEAKRYGWSSDAITLLGSSAGGQMVSLLGSANATYAKFLPNPKQPERYRIRSVVSIDGLQAFIHPQSAEDIERPNRPSAAAQWFGLPLSQERASRIEASALTHVNSESASFLFLRSGQARFHAGDEQMKAALRDYEITYELYESGNTPHTFWLFHPWFQPMMETIIQFVRTESGLYN